MNCSDPVKFLQTVPLDYTVDMAYVNYDILQTPDARSINTGRLNLFIQNVENGIPDCVFVTTFGLDGPATTSILKFDGRNITYTIDNRRFNIENRGNDSLDTSIRTYNIRYLYTDITSADNLFTTNYHAVTTDNLDYTIYNDIVFTKVKRLF